MLEKKSLIPSENIRIQERLAIFLAFIAGYTDATGLLKWKTYVSFMSGNTTQLGAAFFSEKYGIIITSLTVIICFSVGIFTGTCLSLSEKFRSKKLPFYSVAGILILYSVTSYFFSIPTVLSIAVIGLSMGMMNTILTSVGNLKVNTDFVTGTLNSLAKSTAIFTMSKDDNEKSESKADSIHLLLLWIGFLLGAAVSPFLLDLLGNSTLLVPAILLLISASTIPILTFKN